MFICSTMQEEECYTRNKFMHLVLIWLIDIKPKSFFFFSSQYRPLGASWKIKSMWMDREEQNAKICK